MKIKHMFLDIEGFKADALGSQISSQMCCCWWLQANTKVKVQLETDIRKFYLEHKLGHVATHPLSFEEEGLLVTRVGQRYEVLRKDFHQLKVIVTLGH
jgi:hypothetical protein